MAGPPNSRWPAKVVSEKEADEEIRISPKKGFPGRYYAEGRRFKAVVLNDNAGDETVVVFISREKTVEGEKSKTR